MHGDAASRQLIGFVSDRMTPYLGKSNMTKLVGVAAVLISLVGGYVGQSTYKEAEASQTQQIATYVSVLDAFNSWQISDCPALAEWVTSPLSAMLGNSEVQASGAGTVIAWISFIVMKLKKKEE